MKKCAVVYNPESGKPRDKKDIKMLPSILEINGYEARLCPTKCPKDAINIIKDLSDDTDLVICCGGDGTLNEGVTGNLARDKKILMGHLPVGTVNDVGSMYGFTKNMVVNAQMLCDGSVRNIDVCMVNGKPFVYVACIGSYVDSSYNTPRKLKKKFGRLAYFMHTLVELKDRVRLFNLTYEVEDKVISGTYSFVFVSNTCRMGGFNNIYKDVKLDDDMFEVVLCTAKTKAELALLGTKILAGEVKSMPGLEVYKTNRFRIIFEDMPPSWVIDGEEYKHSTREFLFTINKDINMLIPEKNIVKLFSSLEEYNGK